MRVVGWKHLDGKLQCFQVSNIFFKSDWQRQHDGHQVGSSVMSCELRIFNLSSMGDEDGAVVCIMKLKWLSSAAGVGVHCMVHNEGKWRENE